MKQRFKHIFKASNDDGSAMITAVIVGMVMMSFCLALLLVCYSLYAQTDRQTTQLQCRELAQSVAQEIKSEIEEKNDDGVVITDSKIRQYLLDEIKSGRWEEGSYNLSFSLDKNGADSLLNLYDVIVKMSYEVESKSEDPSDPGSAYTVYVRVIAQRGTENDSDQIIYVADTKCDLTDH